MHCIMGRLGIALGTSTLLAFGCYTDNRSALEREFAEHAEALTKIRHLFVELGPESPLMSIGADEILLQDGRSIPLKDVGTDREASPIADSVAQLHSTLQGAKYFSAGVSWSGHRPTIFVVIDAFGGVLGVNKGVMWTRSNPNEWAHFDRIDEVPGHEGWYFYRQ